LGVKRTCLFALQTRQVRVFADVRGYLSFGSTAITTSSRAGNGAMVEIGASLVGEYFGVTPGIVLAFSSSSTSSGSIFVSEMG